MKNIITMCGCNKPKPKGNPAPKPNQSPKPSNPTAPRPVRKPN